MAKRWSVLSELSGLNDFDSDDEMSADLLEGVPRRPERRLHKTPAAQADDRLGDGLPASREVPPAQR
jgi:hypothetical protein